MWPELIQCDQPEDSGHVSGKASEWIHSNSDFIVHLFPAGWEGESGEVISYSSPYSLTNHVLLTSLALKKKKIPPGSTPEEESMKCRALQCKTGYTVTSQGVKGGTTKYSNATLPSLSLITENKDFVPGTKMKFWREKKNRTLIFKDAPCSGNPGGSSDSFALSGLSLHTQPPPSRVQTDGQILIFTTTSEGLPSQLSENTCVRNEFCKLTPVSPSRILSLAEWQAQPGSLDSSEGQPAVQPWFSENPLYFLRRGLLWRVRKGTKNLPWVLFGVGVVRSTEFRTPFSKSEKLTSLSWLDLTHFSSLMTALPRPWSSSQMNFS